MQTCGVAANLGLSRASACKIVRTHSRKPTHQGCLRMSSWIDPAVRCVCVCELAVGRQIMRQARGQQDFDSSGETMAPRATRLCAPNNYQHHVLYKFGFFRLIDCSSIHLLAC
eukprot:1924075-Amphidinium_carterae.1